jgi:hypothetical protein
LDFTARWISDLVDPRSPKQLRLTRTARLVTAVAASVVCLVYVIMWAIAPKNIALRKPVTATNAWYSSTPEAAVDGVKTGTYGYHSAEADSPWLTVDLGHLFAVKRVRVFGRGDGVLDQSIPLALEFSDDGLAYQLVATRTQEFSESNPWTVILSPPRSTRFVKLRTERRSVLVLGEVEVNGDLVH